MMPLHNRVITIPAVLVLLLVLFPNQNCTHKNRAFTIGIAQWVSNPEYVKNIDGFKEELAARGFVEGKNVAYLLRVCNADKLKQKEIIREFTDKKVDLIYSLTTPGTLIARKESAGKIPIVFSIVTYPVETGVIQSLAGSGGNIVGSRNYVPPSKQFYVFERIRSDVKAVAFVHRKGEPNSCIQLNEFKAILEPRGIRVVEIAAIDIDDLKNQLDRAHGAIDAIYSACDTLIQSGGEEVVIDFCKRYAVPSFTCNKDGVLKGALVGNVADFYTIGKISGEKAALILGGADPQWLQTESPREDYIVVNLKTAAALGVKVPEEIMQQAKEIVRE
jgi:putative tryptophan/tyrosine transport system substrate-binding protein